MRRLFLMLIVPGLAACATGGYTRAEVIYAQPAEYVYVVPVDHVVRVSRDVLITHGYTVYRVERSRAGRVIWARRPGRHQEIVRIFVTPRGERVAVRGLVEARKRGRHKGWERHGPPKGVLKDISRRLRRH